MKGASKLALTWIGVGKAHASPPSEPCWRFSRTRLSSRQFPHRDGLANGFPRANPPFRVTATARKSSAGLQPLAGLDRSSFSGHLPEGYPVRLTVSVPAFPPSYPPSLWTVLLPARYHLPRSWFRLVFVFPFPAGFPPGPQYPRLAATASDLRYYGGSDSCRRSPRRQASPLTAHHLLTVPPPTTKCAPPSFCTPSST